MSSVLSFERREKRSKKTIKTKFETCLESTYEQLESATFNNKPIKEQYLRSQRKLTRIVRSDSKKKTLQMSLKSIIQNMDRNLLISGRGTDKEV